MTPKETKSVLALLTRITNGKISVEEAERGLKAW